MTVCVPLMAPALRQRLRRRLKVMTVIPQTDFIQGQFAFKPKKILFHIKQPSTN